MARGNDGCGFNITKLSVLEGCGIEDARNRTDEE